MVTEEWNQIKVGDLLTNYKCSSDGRFMTGRTGKWRLMNPKNRYRGYIVFALILGGGKIHRESAHRLIAKEFIPNPENKPYINHKNGIKDDNRVINLEWNTGKENTKHAYSTGLAKGRKGQEHHMTSLTNDKVLEIFNCELSNVEISKKYNIPHGTVSEIKTGAAWSDITGKKYERSLISNDTVLSIFNSTLSVKETAKTYNVSIKSVSTIKNGRYWGNITGKKHVKKKKLTAAEILKVYNSKRTIQQLMIRYKVGKNVIAKIKCGMTWTNITKSTKRQDREPYADGAGG